MQLGIYNQAPKKLKKFSIIISNNTNLLLDNNYFIWQYQ